MPWLIWQIGQIRQTIVGRVTELALFGAFVCRFADCWSRRS
ncbi:hypothetical protein [Streptomyces rhizosphaerihabitans]|nr:hypothetical protein [Streptomyces rhizosphaerihabitans]MCT9007818.1 hypothetical protein [Streptomyces rhizosphaerihabitans]